MKRICPVMIMAILVSFWGHLDSKAQESHAQRLQSSRIWVLDGFGQVHQTSQSPPESLSIMLPGNVEMELILIPAGAFLMGSEGDPGWSDSNTRPVHEVRFDKPFYMGKYEVTQAQWRALMEWPSNPPIGRDYQGGNYAAYFISWENIQDYIARLNEHIAATRQGAAIFRLPSESEWEYAARAGTSTRFWFGDSDCSSQFLSCEPCSIADYVWYCGNSLEAGARQVGLLPPDPFGLYDMNGNVAEMVQDIYQHNFTGAPSDGSAWEASGQDRVVRSGGWMNSPYMCSSIFRSFFPVKGVSPAVGFRLARSLE